MDCKDIPKSSRCVSDPYRCFALMKPNGSWRSWTFVPDSPVVRQRFQDRSGSEVLFASVQRFHPPVNMAGILKWKEAGSQYRGENALPHIAPFYFDIDCENGLADALLLTHGLHEFFTGELGVSSDHIGVWFSGSKGAHLLVHHDALGIKPSPTLSRDMKSIAMGLCDRLARQHGIPHLSADDNVYSMPRMLRVENQLNIKSKLYKVRLTPTELSTCDVQHIKKLASAPRKLEPLTEDKIPVSDKALAWWTSELKKAKEPEQFRQQTARIAGVKIRPDGFSEDELQTDQMPDCMVKLLTAHPPEGKRNRSEMQIACWAHSVRKPQNEAVNLLARWIHTNRPELEADQCKRRAAGITLSAYSGKYGFSCRAVLSALKDSGISANCDTCQAVTQKHPRMIASVRVSKIHDVVRQTISLEEARERTQKLARIACAG